jgi:hypothetical protein
MRSTVLIGTMATLASALWQGKPAWADGTSMPGTRPLGTGGALRGSATGDAGPMLNPSGISLMRAYVVEGAYQYSGRDSGNGAHVSVVDSTSSFNLGGALSYTFFSAKPQGSNQTVHLGGASLSFPFSDLIFVGASAKYLYWSSTQTDGTRSTTRGFILDAGLTIRPIPIVSLGVTGYNLTNRDNPFAPQAVGGGLSVTVFPGLSLLFDSVLERASGRSNPYYIMGGAEYLTRTFAVRLGGGRDGLYRASYVSGGVSAVSTVGTLEFALRQDISGDHKATFVGVSARLFVFSS